MYDYISKISAEEINDFLLENYAFICFASFEERCFTLSNYINANKTAKSYVIRNIDVPMDNENVKNLDIIKNKISKIKIETIHLSDPVTIADKLFYIICEIIDDKIKNIVVDISTFTHEALLMLLKTLYINKSNFESIKLVYNGASEYSSWLSKGCKEVRNVIGYPGIFKPSQKYHLIVLTGFEQERATRLLELLEPDSLSIGNGIEPTDNNHNETMKIYKSKFQKWLDSLQGMTNESFEFSCSDIETTVSKLKEIIQKKSDENIILVPLNTKLSTISVAIIALTNSKIQVCYPIPEVYNISYSKPSNNFTIIELMKNEEFVKK